MLVIDPQGPGHLGQGRQQGAIDGGKAAQGLGFAALQLRQVACGQGPDDFAQQRGVEDAAGFAERTQGGPFAAQESLHLGKGAGLLEAAQAGADGIEEAQQEQAGELVVMEHAVASAVAGGGVGVEALQERPQSLEVLEALQVAFGNRGTAFGSHTWIRCAKCKKLR